MQIISSEHRRRRRHRRCVLVRFLRCHDDYDRSRNPRDTIIPVVGSVYKTASFGLRIKILSSGQTCAKRLSTRTIVRLRKLHGVRSHVGNRFRCDGLDVYLRVNRVRRRKKNNKKSNIHVTGLHLQPFGRL